MIPFPFQAGQLGHTLSRQSPPPPLDIMTGFAAAYSISRRIRTAYAGFAFRVKNSSTLATTDIGFDAFGDVDTAAVLAALPSLNGYVDTIYDQSGNGIDLTQAGAVTLMPSVKNTSNVFNNSFNGRLAANSDGGDYLTSATSFDVQTAKKLSVTVVKKNDAGSTDAGIVCLQRNGTFDFAGAFLLSNAGAGTGYDLTYGNGTTAAFNANQYRQLRGSDANVTSLQVVQAYLDASATLEALYVDGTAKTLTNPGGTLAGIASWLTLGSGNFRLVWSARSNSQVNTITNQWPGSIAEVYVALANQTADQATLRGNCKEYFATA